jgi:L-fuculose-phosphate aldolase
MLITPTGIPYEKLTESHIVYIDADGQHEQENCRPVSGVSI